MFEFDLKIFVHFEVLGVCTFKLTTKEPFIPNRFLLIFHLAGIILIFNLDCRSNSFEFRQ